MSTDRIGGPPTTMAGPRPAGPPEGFSLQSTNKRYGEKLIIASLFACGALSVLITIGIAWALIAPAIAFFQQVSVVEFLTGTKWAPRFKPPAYGVLPLVMGTLWTTGIALLVAVPFGLGAAVYLAEYAPERRRKTLKPMLELLAGIPSVVYGFFALEFMTKVVLQDWLDLPVGTFNVLSAGIVLGVMIIPTVASLSEDALSAVPAGDPAGLLRAGGQPDADDRARRLPRGHLRHRRGGGPRDLAWPGRDHDRGHSLPGSGPTWSPAPSRAARR